MFAEQYLKEMINCFNHILEYRDYENILLRDDPDFNGIVDKRKLKQHLLGNIAVCSLLKDNEVISNCHIAGSVNAYSDVRSSQFDSYIKGTVTPSHIASLIGSGDENFFRYKHQDVIWVSLPYPDSTSYIFQPTYGGKENRLHDSERILINTLQGLINHDFLKFDTVLMVTERIPCQSCTHIIMEFAWRNKLNIKLAYWLDSGTGIGLRNFESLKKQIRKNKRAMRYIEICEIILKVDSRIHFSSRYLT